MGVRHAPVVVRLLLGRCCCKWRLRRLTIRLLPPEVSTIHEPIRGAWSAMLLF